MLVLDRETSKGDQILLIKYFNHLLAKREENSFALHSGEFALRPRQLYHQLQQTATEKGRNRDSLFEWCGARIAVPGWPFRDY